MNQNCPIYHFTTTIVYLNIQPANISRRENLICKCINIHITVAHWLVIYLIVNYFSLKELLW